MSIQALKHALENIKNFRPIGNDATEYSLTVEHIARIALERAEQAEKTVECMCGICKLGKREWVGLTDEEVHQGFCHVEYETPNDWNTDPDDWCQQFARYLEAKLKEKNT